MDLSAGRNFERMPPGDPRPRTVPIGTVPIYAMIIGRQIEASPYDLI